MKKLTINITKAQLTSFEVKLEDGKPVVNVTIALLNEGNEVITSYTIFSDEWHSKKFELPIEAMPLIGQLATIFEGVAVRHCMGSQLAIAAPKPNNTAVLKGFSDELDGTEVNVVDEAGEPINLDDIDFGTAKAVA